MNILLLMLGLLAGEATQHQLEVPAYMERPEVKWVDLDGEGTLDILVYDRRREIKDRVWILDGTTPQKGFKEVVFEPLGVDVDPVRLGDTWTVTGYKDGARYRFNPSQGWEMERDDFRHIKIRPGMDPFRVGSFDLIPTHAGYMIMDGACSSHEFMTAPSITLAKGKMNLVWPKPISRDMNGDGEPDLTSTPVVFANQGEVRVRSAIRQGDGWHNREARLQIPAGLKVTNFEYGDLDGDDIYELVVVASPAQDMSIFEEMSFIVYSGVEPGLWEPVPAQVLKTKQNIWQTGPMEVNTQGIFLYYYKGLIRSNFKIDRFVWNKAGFIEPKPKSAKWKLKDAARQAIVLDYDLNGDGATDLVLTDRDGVYVYYRKSKQSLPFTEQVDQVLLNKDVEEGRVSVPFEGLDIDMDYQGNIGRGRLRGNGGLALVPGQKGAPAQLWTLAEGNNGYWYLKELKP